MFNFGTFGLAPAAFILILSTARTVRLIIFDDFPPMMWLREHILARYKEDSKWAKLWQCPFCLAPYILAVIAGWAWVSDFHWTWWVINGIWGLSYIASIIVAYDQPE